MNRIDQKFKDLRRLKRKAFIAFITAGDPGLRTTEQLVVSFEGAGVDIIELGIPFSDSLADGPTIQASYHRALVKKVTVRKILRAVRHLRRKTAVPIALMSSYNPILRFGEEKFIKACSDCGVDGLIVPDLPPEEAANLCRAARRFDIVTIFFVAPTTQDARIKANTKASRGFVYYMSLTGITGTQQAIASSVVKHIKHIRRYTSKPVCAGFGISTPQQVKAIGRVADGVIVGSAIVKCIKNYAGRPNLVGEVSRYVRTLSKSLNQGK